VALRYRTLLAVAAAVAFALTGTACSGGGTSGGPADTPSSGPGGGIPLTPAPGPGKLSEAGSTLLLQLMGTWASAYHQQHPNVSITTAGGGSTKGISDASAGTVSIGTSDAYLSSGDLVKNPALLNVPLAISAQQVNYNVRPGTWT
jgi:phosphate transport system substrate-binding protein